MCAVEKDNGEWISELKKGETFKAIVEAVEVNKPGVAVKMPGERTLYRAANFLIEKGQLEMVTKSGDLVAVVPKSNKENVVHEAHDGAMAGYFNSRKVKQAVK